MIKGDRYKLVVNGIISDLDLKIVFKLYTPIIGVYASSLYLLFNSDILETESISYLLKLLNISLPSFIQAREKLEAIGLLKTYQKTDAYLFVISKPLSYVDFLANPLLNVSLYNNVGDEAYKKLIKYFEVKKINTAGFENITAKFDEIFETQKGDFILEIEDETSQIMYKNHLDVDVLKSSLPDNVYNDKTFNHENIYLLDTLAHIYKLDEIKMVNLLKIVIKNKKIDTKHLREVARDNYKFNNYGSLPTIVYKKERLKTNAETIGKEESLIKTFKENSPYDYLKSKYKNGNPSDRELKIIEKLLLDYKFRPEVVNVLISYVLQVNNSKFTTGFVDAVAAQWNRLNISNAHEAIKIAREEFNKKRKVNKKISVKKESFLPSWTDQKIETDELSTEEQEKLKDLLF